MTARDDQLQVLRYLYRRLIEGDKRYCTIATIKKNANLDVSNEYILTISDDLHSAGMIMTRQAHQLQGGKLFQITAAGIDAVQNGAFPTIVDSSAWTGRFNLSEAQRLEILSLLEEMRGIVQAARLSNSRTANAMAIIESVERLIDTPDPLWPEIMRLLRSPTLTGIIGIASFLMSIVQIVMAAAST